MNFDKISKELSIPVGKVKVVERLLEEGNTIPFIARYRKEKTGNLDEVQIQQIQSSLEAQKELEKRREFVIEQIGEKGKLTEELEKMLLEAEDIQVIEDLYLPYKTRRKSRGDVARENGLEPLAKIIFEQKQTQILQQLINYRSEVFPSNKEILQGAQDIIAEWINENVELRAKLRESFENYGVIRSKAGRGKKDKEEAQKFRDYFDYSDRINKVPSHRLMAILRGVELGMLSIKVELEEDWVQRLMNRMFLKGYNDLSDIVKESCQDSYSRLLQPSLEKEIINQFKEKADIEAIEVFAMNAEQLLLAPPLGPQSVLAIDPGFRTGCKMVCLSQTGDLLFNITIYPHEPQRKVGEASEVVKKAIIKYDIQAIAVGNGTAGRETYQFVKDFCTTELPVYMVNESGASIYSASELAREEFPDYDVTVRGAVSIGRRLIDPLAELVKIDPKSIGVGQYQHDVNQSLLNKRLTAVVESVVNRVGVNLNTASKHILTYISGLGPVLAQNIIDYRKEIGGFESREALKKVPRLGNKAFEQCAGFLRVPDSSNVLDNTGVHPERYRVVEKMAKVKQSTIKQLVDSPQILKEINLSEFIDEGSALGLPTLEDIIKEIQKPGLDPRGDAEQVKFDDQVRSMRDLRQGMILNGIITNITNFGAFVDIGVKQDGLVHISQIADKFISHPSEAVKLGEQVRVKVVEIDEQRKRIGLSMRI